MVKDMLSKRLKGSYPDAEKCAKAAVFAVFCIQVAFIIFINLFKCRSWIDHDASMLYSHTIHMWEQKKFVIPFYREETFLHLDTSCIFAMPLYGLTHDIFLAYGISNVIFLVITLWAMNDLLKKLDVKDTFRYAAMLLYLIPYRVGLVQYTNMLFFECSFYNVCILVTVLLIDLFLYPAVPEGDRKGRVKYYLILAVYGLFTALTAFSRGTYTLLVALIPVILCYALEVILSEDGIKHLKGSKLIIIAVTGISYALGMGYGKLTGAEPKVSGYSLVLPRDMFDNFVHVFWGHLSIFLEREEPHVFTPEGVKTLILLAYAMLIIVLFIFNLKHAFSDGKYSNALRYMTLIYLWNCCILGVTNCSESEYGFPERYLFPGFIPLLLSVPVALTYIGEIKRKLLKYTMFFGVSVLALLVLAECDLNVRSCFRQNREDLQGIKEVIALARENGIDTVFFINDDNAGLISRSLDPELRVVSVETHDDGTYEIKSRENYLCAADRAYYGDDNVLALPWNVQPESVLNEYQRSSYQYVCDVKDYHIYYAGSDKFDGRHGFPLNDNVMDHSTDFCYTDGYESVGEIDLYGYLEATGEDDYVLMSPSLHAPYTRSRVVLRYESGHKTKDEAGTPQSGSRVLGTFLLLDEDNNPVSSAEIKSDAAEAVLDADPDRRCRVAVKLDPGEKITIRQIDFSAEK